MSTQDLLNTLLAVGFLIITICVLAITFFLIKALKAITELSQSIANTTEGIRDNIKIRALTALPALVISLLGKLIRRR